MSYYVQAGDIVKLDSATLKVLSAPSMSSHFAARGETFGWVKCKVLKDPSGKYEPGYISEFNGDFIRKI